MNAAPPGEPTGGFSHGGGAYVFAGGSLFRKDDLAAPGPFQKIWDAPSRFQQTAACVDSDHLLLFGNSYNDGVHLARMPLDPAAGPLTDRILYYAGHADGWTADPSHATALFPAGPGTSVSVAWLEGPRRWIALTTSAAPSGPVVARFGASPWEWSEEIETFRPAVRAYGAFLLNRFTRWDAERRDVSLYYLLSFDDPRQVHVMFSRLRLPQEGD
jgi:hypothetical protein